MAENKKKTLSIGRHCGFFGFRGKKRPHSLIDGGVSDTWNLRTICCIESYVSTVLKKRFSLDKLKVKLIETFQNF